MISIYDLRWGKTSFLAKLVLLFNSHRKENKKTLSKDPRDRASGFSALSSTYYSIAGTAAVQLNNLFRDWRLLLFVPFRAILWGALGVWCYWLMLPFSDRVVKLIGYEGMSPDQCVVRQSILRKRGRLEEASQCINLALAKNPRLGSTRGLLLVASADIRAKEGKLSLAKEILRAAIAEGSDAERIYPEQAARIYRHAADIFDFICGHSSEEGQELRREAEVLAKKAGSKDQVLKLVS